MFCIILRVRASRKARQLIKKGQWKLVVFSVVKNMPVAIFLPDGTVLSHGGIPQTDLMNTCYSIDDLNESPYVDDFIWNRMKSVWSRMVNRSGSLTQEVGFNDWNYFAMKISSIIDVKIERLVRGQCHHPERFNIEKKNYGSRLITINNMSIPLRRESANLTVPGPVIAKWRSGKSLELHALSISADNSPVIGQGL